MKPLKNTLRDLPLKGSRVLVRADLNVPRNKDGDILNDFKLRALLPTLDFIKQQGGAFTLIGHCGRPVDKESRLSLAQVADWLEKHNFTIHFTTTIETTLKQLQRSPDENIVLENLRFFKEETDLNQHFAKQLAQLGTYFVQDAFGTLHRNHTSMTLLANEFDSTHKTIGLLIEKELKVLDQLTDKSSQPFLLILGGNKIKTKLPIIEHLLEKIDTLLLCPAIAFTLMKAKGEPVGKSLVDESLLHKAQELIQKAQEKNVHIIFPVDFLVTKNSFEKPVPCNISKKIEPDETGITFGPETTSLLKKFIKKAKIIFLNGISGNEEYPETMEGMRLLFQALKESSAQQIIGGGDAVSTSQKYEHTQKNVTFLTGGGATLAYLSKQFLPGLDAIS